MRVAHALTGVVCTLGIISISTSASAIESDYRCNYDYITEEGGGIGRNAWAEKWGYLLPEEAATLNSLGLYIEFSNGCYRTNAGALCSPSVPISQNGAYVPGLIPYGLCWPSCYTPRQRVLFGGSYSGVEDAAKVQSRTVTALSNRSTSNDLSYSEQPIKQFVSGATEEEIYVLHGDGEQRVEVTSGHPMVRIDGTLVKAIDLREGDVLLSESGKPVQLIKIETFLFKGEVWNIRPVSDDKADNVLVAEGLLTGSQRFQANWANEDFRLFVRGRVNVAMILDAEPR